VIGRCLPARVSNDISCGGGVVVVCVVADGGPPCLRHSPGCLSSRSAVSLLPTRPFPPVSRTYRVPSDENRWVTRGHYGATSVRGGWMSRMVKTGVTFVHNEIQQLQTSISSSYSTHPTLHQADHCQSWWGERSSSCKRILSVIHVSSSGASFSWLSTAQLPPPSAPTRILRAPALLPRYSRPPAPLACGDHEGCQLYHLSGGGRAIALNTAEYARSSSLNPAED